MSNRMQVWLGSIASALGLAVLAGSALRGVWPVAWADRLPGVAVIGGAVVPQLLFLFAQSQRRTGTALTRNEVDREDIWSVALALSGIVSVRFTSDILSLALTHAVLGAVLLAIWGFRIRPRLRQHIPRGA